MEAVKRGRGRPRKVKPGETNLNLPCKFFIIILPCTMQQKRLRIPEKFASRYSSQIPAVATLSVPTERTWNVAISKIGSKIYFTQGWEEFMNHNSIQYGYFLEFEYKCNSHFRVYIFDLSCCEIDYPCKACGRPTAFQHVSCPSKNEDPVEVKEEEEAVQECMETDSESSSFTVTARDRNFSGRYLYVSSSFANKNSRNMKAKVKLLANDGRVWHLRWHRPKSQKCVYLFNASGWKNFMQENCLSMGDLFTIKMVDEKHDEVLLKLCKP